MLRSARAANRPKCQHKHSNPPRASANVLAQTRRCHGISSSSSPVVRWWLGRPIGRCRWQWPSTAESPAAWCLLASSSASPRFSGNLGGTKGSGGGGKMPGQLVCSKIWGSVSLWDWIELYIAASASEWFDRRSPTCPESDCIDLQVQAAWVHLLVHRCLRLKCRVMGVGW